MSWEFISSLIATIIGSNILMVLLNRRANRRKAEAEADKAQAEAELALAANARAEAEAKTEEWELYKDQLAHMQKQVIFKDERIETLLKLNADKESRFVEQTARLRETQRREQDANESILALTREVADLKLQLKDHKCLRLSCLDREPENEHTRKARLLTMQKKDAE